jgi:hypothetical protein
MATDPRRFDQIAKVVADDRRQLNDVSSTLLARLAAHTHSAYAGTSHSHAESDVTSLVTDLAGKALTVHTHAATDITAATLHESRYEQRTLQTLTTSTDTKLKFDSINTSCSDITASGTGNTDFNLIRGGLWVITAAVRYVAGTSGERHIFIQTGTVFNAANRFASQTAVNVGTAPVTVTCSAAIRFAANTSICVGGWQNNGGNLNTDVGFGGTAHLSMSWLRP